MDLFAAVYSSRQTAAQSKLRLAGRGAQAPGICHRSRTTEGYHSSAREVLYKKTIDSCESIAGFGASLNSGEAQYSLQANTAASLWESAASAKPGRNIESANGALPANVPDCQHVRNRARFGIGPVKPPRGKDSDCPSRRQIPGRKGVYRYAPARVCARFRISAASPISQRLRLAVMERMLFNSQPQGS